MGELRDDRDGPPSPRRWPMRRDVVLVAVTAPLSWMMACLFHSPLPLDSSALAFSRTAPVLHANVAELAGEGAGRMVLAVDLANLGPDVADLSVTVRPIPGRAAFGGDLAFRVTPGSPFTSRVKDGVATIRLPGPMATGTDLSLRISGIDAPTLPRPRSGAEQRFDVGLLVGTTPVRLDYYRNLPPPRDEGGGG